jgi:hypothetical protein
VNGKCLVHGPVMRAQLDRGVQEPGRPATQLGLQGQWVGSPWSSRSVRRAREGIHQATAAMPCYCQSSPRCLTIVAWVSRSAMAVYLTYVDWGRRRARSSFASRLLPPQIPKDAWYGSRPEVQTPGSSVVS